MAVLYQKIALEVKGFSLSGYCVNHIAILPRFAGILMGITNMVSTTPSPVVLQHARKLVENGTRSEWQIVFIIASQRSTLERWKNICSHCTDFKGHLQVSHQQDCPFIPT